MWECHKKDIFIKWNSTTQQQQNATKSEQEILREHIKLTCEKKGKEQSWNWFFQNESIEIE